MCRGTFLFLYLLIGVLFKLECIIFIIIASCVIELGLEVEASRKALYGCSSPGPRVGVDLIGRDCESEISEILLMVDLRVIDISGLDVILDMD